MLRVESRDARNTQIDPDLFRSICRDIKSLLENSRNELSGEIRNYPPPIPACDAHFNYLLEERAKVSHELNRIDELSGGNPAGRNPADLIDEFIRSCAYIDDATKRTIRARLR